MPYAFEIVDGAGTLLMDGPLREMPSEGKQPGRRNYRCRQSRCAPT